MNEKEHGGDHPWGQKKNGGGVVAALKEGPEKKRNGNQKKRKFPTRGGTKVRGEEGPRRVNTWKENCKGGANGSMGGHNTLLYGGKSHEKEKKDLKRPKGGAQKMLHEKIEDAFGCKKKKFPEISEVNRENKQGGEIRGAYIYYTNSSNERKAREGKTGLWKEGKASIGWTTFRSFGGGGWFSGELLSQREKGPKS